MNNRFLDACWGKPVDRTPVWLMRQAGRYLPEYMAVRSRCSFLELCKTPELAAEVTIQPVDILGVDAAILYLIANSFPILGINLQGNGNAVTLLQAVHELWKQDMPLVSSLTFVTAILVPALELCLMLYLLLPLYRGYAPAGTSQVMRLLQTIKPWGMVEVFMLGILVSLVKLVQDFKIIPGVALWSFGGLTLLLAALASSFNPRDVWAHLDLKQRREGL